MTAAFSPRFLLRLAMGCAVALLSASSVHAAKSSPNVSLRIITFGDTRAQLQATPIEQRPSRPLHFYGNRVRRQNSRASSSRTTATRTSNTGRSRR